MKIIEHGFYKQVITCQCGCKFQYERTDAYSVEKVINIWNKAETRKELYVKCPECEQQYAIPDKIVVEL